MDEFALIERILAEFRDPSGGGPPAWLRLGPGDDAALTRPPAGHELASSIDSFLADVHFPSQAAPELIGYRCMMASLSDLAAMAATPAWALAALCLPEGREDWALRLSRGMAEAAREAKVELIGGNLAAGPVCLTLSVQGWAPSGTLLSRKGARPGDAVCVSGPLGGSAQALNSLDVAHSVPGRLRGAELAYWRPQPPFDLAAPLRRHASAGIDLSDGLLQDLNHLCTASGVGARLHSRAIPLAHGASLETVLGGGDDYVLAFTTSHAPLQERCARIGEIFAGRGLQLDGKPVQPQGFRHFSGVSVQPVDRHHWSLGQ